MREKYLAIVEKGNEELSCEYEACEQLHFELNEDDEECDENE